MAKNTNQFEQLIEFIINEDEAKAKALFHKIVVNKSRDIYESLVEADDEEGPVPADDGAESFGDEIEADQDQISGDEEGIEGDDEFGGDEEFGGEEGGEEFGGEEASVEDRVMDLEDAIDELKAEFDEVMGGGAGDGDADDFGGEPDGDFDDAAFDDEGGSDFDSEEGGENVGDAELDGDSEEDKFGGASVYGESKTGKSPADLMREYVEKVGQNWPKGAGDGDPIGSGGTKSPINSKSPMISGKNDMGGTTANIAKGGTASDKDSNTGPKKPSNAYTKGETKMGQDKYENSPAANTKGYKDKRTVKREQEGQTTKETVPVVKKSFNPGGKPGFKG
jgi:hypothetical protein